MRQNREKWVDEVKLIACIFVVLGHFYQSMVTAEIVNDNVFYRWFLDTIYCFHVPLFFICSGYLFQKHSKVNSISEYIRNICKKALALGVPYFVFSSITWVLKTGASSFVNNQIGSLTDILFVRPTSPYWFLYVLFLMFVISFTVNSRMHAFVILALALVFKVLSGFNMYIGIAVIDRLLDTWVWFVFGMLFAFGGVRIENRLLGYLSFILFVLSDILGYVMYINIPFIRFIVGIFACVAIISLVINHSEEDNGSGYIAFLTQYTMPIFLMHTIFAATVRIILMRMKISNVFVHCTVGIIFSFAGPIIAMIIMDHLKPLDFLVYPGRYIRKVPANR